jgi:hypothetical protein
LGQLQDRRLALRREDACPTSLQTAGELSRIPVQQRVKIPFLGLIQYESPLVAYLHYLFRSKLKQFERGLLSYSTGDEDRTRNFACDSHAQRAL